jgi:hypothetical protein
MLPCTCEIDQNGFLVWSPFCPRHGTIKEDDDDEDE